MIIAGHGRVEAAKVLGVSEIPAIVAKGWSDAQKRAYVLADNQLGLNSGWDEDLLRLEIGAIKGLDFDIGLVGFDDEFLSGLFAHKCGLVHKMIQRFWPRWSTKWVALMLFLTMAAAKCRTSRQHC